jgi:hypothetical protein
MFYDGIDKQGRTVQGGLMRLVYCGKCNQPLSSGVLEPNTVMSTNGLVWTKSGCCRATVITVVTFASKAQIESDPMPTLRLEVGTKGPGSWEARIDENGEVKLAYGSTEKPKGVKKGP